ncbi:16S rRNA processing protein RimM [Deltaproteobacteria bacterium PRO3]|nr:16S rRNA processing protein RimM [Deltaproteobacteria bacterium PRO3]
MSPPSKFVRLGKILQEWGIKGQVRFLSFNPESDLYPRLSYFVPEADESGRLEIESVKRHGRYWLLKLKGYENPETARELRGKVLGLPRIELPRPRRGEVYLSDLEGLEVRAADGTAVGVIAGFQKVGDHEVMRIERAAGGEAMVPYHAEFVESTNLKEGFVALKPYAEALL